MLHSQGRVRVLLSTIGLAANLSCYHRVSCYATDSFHGLSMTSVGSHLFFGPRSSSHAEEAQLVVETILFEKPKDRCKVFVSDLDINVSSDDLRDLFSQFGAVHDVWIGEPSVSPQNQNHFSSGIVGHEFSSELKSASTWGVVTFFAGSAASRALALHGYSFRNRFLKVSGFRRRDSAAAPDNHSGSHLSVAKSIDLMNAFLPMRWTSEVVSLDLVEFQNDPPDQNDTFRGAWTCRAKLLLDGQVEIVGAGFGHHVGEKDEVIQKAKKAALSNARKDAFSRLAIILTSGSKVGYFVSPNPLVTQPLQ